MTTQVFTDAVTLTAASWFNDVDTGTYITLTGAAGTNTVTATGPANYAYAANAPLFKLVAAGTNTAASTLNITPSGGSALGAKNIKKNDASGTPQALSASDMISGGTYLFSYDGTQFILLNPTPEEGSWTPVLAGSSVAGTQSYTTQVGRYIRSGNVVHFWFSIFLSAKDGTTAGNMQINGLPYSSTTLTGLNAAVALSDWITITLTASYTFLAGLISSNSSAIALFQSGSGQAQLALPASGIAATSGLIGSGSYRIN